MTTGHLIADRNLALLSEVNSDYLVNARLELVAAVLACEHLDVNNDTALAVRHAKGSISNFSCLFAEDCAEQSFLGGELGLSLRSYLTDEDVAGVNLGSDVDDTVLVEILEHIIADIRDVACDFLGSELCITGFGVVFVNMDRCVNIFSYNLFADEYGVLIVITFPGHKADESVLTEGDFAVLGCRAVNEDSTLFDSLASFNNRNLVDTGALVTSEELDYAVILDLAVVVENSYVVSVNTCDNTVALSEHADAGVGTCAVLHACADNRGFGNHKRNCLTLHVGAHQRAVRVVVLEERNH